MLRLALAALLVLAAAGLTACTEAFGSRLDLLTNGGGFPGSSIARYKSSGSIPGASVSGAKSLKLGSRHCGAQKHLRTFSSPSTCSAIDRTAAVA